MLEVNVTNATERRQYQHESGTLICGRAPKGDGEKLFINDLYVSRDQFQLEETESGKIRLQNLGRSSISLPNGAGLEPGSQLELDLPIRLSVGQTVVDIVSASGTASVSFDPSEQTVEGPALDLASMQANRIGEYYPYPLAYTYRLLRGISAPAELYKEQLRLGENLLSYVASVSLSLLENDQFADLNNKIQGGALSCWQGGISPGNWLSLAIHAIDRLATNEKDPLIERLLQLQINKGKRGFGKCIREIITAKNDFKHDRGPNIESEYRAATSAMRETLDSAFALVNFLTIHPLRLVTDINPKRRSDESDIIFLKCMGAHPGFETEHTALAQNLRKGDLYIEREPGRLAPVYPFIQSATCNQCKSREFFFVDRVDMARSSDRTATAGLKSFDRGHTEQDAEIGQEMQQIFSDS